MCNKKCKVSVKIENNETSLHRKTSSLRKMNPIKLQPMNKSLTIRRAIVTRPPNYSNNQSSSSSQRPNNRKKIKKLKSNSLANLRSLQATLTPLLEERVSPTPDS
jgi:hypothetical protein